METKPLLFGLIGFFLGGLVVSVAATYLTPNKSPNNSMSSAMQTPTQALSSKTGDEFDTAFIDEMIIHHQGAIDMAKLAEKNAKHDEVKRLSKDITIIQENEVNEMKQWQKKWGYDTNSNEMNHNSHPM